jgi:hypothetical protein
MQALKENLLMGTPQLQPYLFCALSETSLRVGSRRQPQQTCTAPRLATVNKTQP